MLSSVVIIIPLMSKFLPNNRIITSAIDANMKFTVIPAIATQNNPGLSGFNLEKFTGTGFAQPTINPDPLSNNRIGSIIPVKSRCFKGFKVILPSLFAVSSPNLYAT